MNHFLACGYEITAVDDFSSGKKENVPERATLYERDIRDRCANVFEEFEPAALSHRANQRIYDVRQEPDFGDDIHIIGTLRLLKNFTSYVLRKVVASMGGAIYGVRRELPGP